MDEPKQFERKLIEMTAGSPENSRFSVCYLHNGKWIMDDNPYKTIESCGYRLIAIHDLPERTAIKSQVNSIDADKELEIMKEKFKYFLMGLEMNYIDALMEEPKEILMKVASEMAKRTKDLIGIKTDNPYWKSINREND